jgi:predicted DNA-binding protein (MmcQ/YjbR family)
MTTQRTRARRSARTASDQHTGGAAVEPLRRHGHGRLAQFCLSLPETDAYTATGQHASFRVRGKSFLYYLDDHHGDGRIAINCKTGHLEQEELVAAAPERYFMPPYMAHHGWVGLRLDVGEVEWDEVNDLVVNSYRLIAPKRLAAIVDANWFGAASPTSGSPRAEK